jgi:hypothetical protein
MTEVFRLRVANGSEWIMDPPVDPYGDGFRRATVQVRADGRETSRQCFRRTACHLAWQRSNLPFRGQKAVRR